MYGGFKTCPKTSDFNWYHFVQEGGKSEIFGLFLDELILKPTRDSLWGGFKTHPKTSDFSGYGFVHERVKSNKRKERN